MAQKFTVPITVKQLSSAGSDAITIYVDSDAYSRLKVEAGGRLVWGSGSGTADTNLYRDSADVLKTDDTFKAAALFVDNIEIDTTGATSGQVLKFDGTKFAPDADSGTLSIDGLTDVTITSATTGDLLRFNGSVWAEDTLEINDLEDVSTSSPSNGQVLAWNGSAWANATPSAAASVTIGDSAPSSPSSGDLWWESVTARLKIYYTDTDSSQWVDAFTAQISSLGFIGNMDGGTASSTYGGIPSLDGGSA